MQDIIKINIKIRLENEILKLMAQEGKLISGFLNRNNIDKSGAKLEAYQNILDILKEF